MPRWTSLGGLVGPLLFAVVAALCGALRPGYDPVRQFISELGEQGGSHSGLMNAAGFMFAASCIGAFVVALRSRVRGSAMAAIGTAALALFSAAMFASGVFSCDAGCLPREPSLHQRLHDLAAMVGFPSLIAGTIFLGLHFRTRPSWRDLAPWSLVAGVVGAALLAALVASAPERIGTGLIQRLMLGTLFLWLAAVSARLWRTWDA